MPGLSRYFNKKFFVLVNYSSEDGRKENSTHQYEVDFLIIKNGKISPIEVKSSSVRYHSSITEFAKKYSSQVNEQYLISQKDVGKEGMLKLKPIYLLPFILETSLYS